MFIMQNRRPLKIGGPRRLPSMPNGRTGLVDPIAAYISHYEASIPGIRELSEYLLSVVRHYFLRNSSFLRRSRSNSSSFVLPVIADLR